MHHVLAVGFKHLFLLLTQLLDGLVLFVLDVTDVLVELGLGHVGQLGVEIWSEKVVDGVCLLDRIRVKNLLIVWEVLERIIRD